MKKITNCNIDNFIPIPSSQIIWDCGDIEYLGICEGDGICNVIVELTNKIKAFSEDDLSEFDIDALAEICDQAVPLEITTLAIFNLIKDTEICLNDKINILSEQIASITNEGAVSVNLKCYATEDNLGNILSIDREAFDQLVIDNLCNQKGRIEGLEGSVTSLQSQIDNIDTDVASGDILISTCINGVLLPTSTQVVNTSQALCDLITFTGDTVDIATALALTPTDLNTEFGLITGWNLTPTNWAENYGNLLLEVESLRQRIIFMEENCCAASCDDILLGFSAVYNEDNTGIIIKFTSGAGTSIPAGYEDQGSTGTITDIDGNVESFTIDIVDNFTNNNETEVLISGLNLTGTLVVDITAKIGNDGLTCEKCIHKNVNQAACAFCEICATGEDGSTVVIIYESSVSSAAYNTSSTTSSSTTTTTTVGF
jgi:hypothetical protein